MNRREIREAIVFLLYQHYELNKDIFDCKVLTDFNEPFVSAKDSKTVLNKEDILNDKNKDLFYINIAKYLSDEDKLESVVSVSSDEHPCYHDVDFYNDDFFKSIISDIKNNEQYYIQEISKLLNDFTFDRLNNVDKAILVLAASEIALFNSKEGYITDKETSTKFIINEALEIAKKYSSSNDSDYKYINAVLDKINV